MAKKLTKEQVEPGEYDNFPPGPTQTGENPPSAVDNSTISFNDELNKFLNELDEESKLPTSKLTQTLAKEIWDSLYKDLDQDERLFFTFMSCINELTFTTTEFNKVIQGFSRYCRENKKNMSTERMTNSILGFCIKFIVALKNENLVDLTGTPEETMDNLKDLVGKALKMFAVLQRKLRKGS